MTTAQEREYRGLTTVAERAAWLLKQGITAEPDINAAGLTLYWRVAAGGVALPGQYTGTRQEAIEQGIAWLQQKAASSSDL
jgi:hypothetical protein